MYKISFNIKNYFILSGNYHIHLNNLIDFVITLVDKI